MNRICIIFLAFTVLLLSGCETFIATAITDSQAAHNAAYEYVSENISIRRQIRERCRDLVMREVDTLVYAGKYAEARAVLKEHYPGLVTMDMVDDGFSSLNEADVCG